MGAVCRRNNDCWCDRWVVFNDGEYRQWLDAEVELGARQSAGLAQVRRHGCVVDNLPQYAKCMREFELNHHGCFEYTSISYHVNTDYISSMILNMGI